MLRRSDLAAAASAIGLGLALKAFYSTAGADDVLWILAPSAWLARTLGGIDLVYEPGAGYITHTYRLIVGPSCAGINFLVIGFLALYFSFAQRWGSRWRWLASSLAVAFAAAIVANAVRIVVSAHLWDASFYREWLGPEEMHRVAGTVIYYGALLGLWTGVDSATHVGRRRARSWIVPFSWYVGISLGVPLAHRFRAGGTTEFREHTLWVLVIATAATLMMFLPSVVVCKIRGQRVHSESQRVDILKRLNGLFDP